MYVPPFGEITVKKNSDLETETVADRLYREFNSLKGGSC